MTFAVLARVARFRALLGGWLCRGLFRFWLTASSAADAEPLVRMTFVDDSAQTVTVEGKVVVEAADGGVLLLGRDGRLWSVTPRQKQSLESTGRSLLAPHGGGIGTRLGWKSWARTLKSSRPATTS